MLSYSSSSLLNLLTNNAVGKLKPAVVKRQSAHKMVRLCNHVPWYEWTQV